MINKIADGPLLADKCRRALGSLHCELSQREKRVLNQLVIYSFALGQDGAMFGSSDQIALLAQMDKGDVSHALSSLRRNRVLRRERANELHPYRRPMLYFVDPHALVRLAQEPTLGRNADAVHRVRADTALWLSHANRSYPLQPDLIAPDPRELELALAEISRASVLAHDFLQNDEPKPASFGAGEAYPSDAEARPGPALLGPSVPTSETVPDPDYLRTGRELGLHPREVARLASQKAHLHAAAAALSTPAPVGNSPTGTDPSWKFSNYSRAGASDVSDLPDGDIISPSVYLQGDPRGPVGNSPTSPPGDDPSFVVKAAMLLADYDEPWTPPTRAQEVFDELRECLGAVMDNYGGWWWWKCVEPGSRRDVVEAIATWKLARHDPRHKPWRGGRWRDEFNRRQRARLGAGKPEGATP